ncbi:MAG TPA: hypothetical protein VEC12_07340 [Bacteroidia bacterium]|nr:hypothetical protein [Bacteroidia bacterium]
MKTLSIFFAALIMLSASCKKADELTKFNMEFNSEVTVPPNTLVNLPIDLLTPDMTTNYEETFSANDTRKDLVEEITIDKITITAKAPQGITLDFLKSITVYISADGIPEKEVASKYDIPDGLTSLDLDYVSDNLKDFLTRETIRLRVKTVTDKAVNQEIDLNVYNRFKVDAKVLGV